MDDTEVSRLAARGAVAGLCPVTEANLGDGIFPATKYLAAGGAFGIGTDSNVSIRVADELRQLEYSQRLRDRARNVIGTDDQRSTGRVLFEDAARGGAQALGVSRRGNRGGRPRGLFLAVERCHRVRPSSRRCAARQLDLRRWQRLHRWCVVRGPQAGLGGKT